MNPNQSRPLSGIKKQMYEEINTLLNSNSYGSFHKCLFHLHTPASYDYLLFDSKKGVNDNYFSDLSEKEIKEIAVSKKLFPNSFDKKSFDYSMYSSFKEFISYLLIAYQICKSEIELIVVSDHNTIEGYDRLNFAIDTYCKSKYVKKHPTIILGIEISCADKLHIVGIFPDLNKQLLLNWLKNNIMSHSDGTYLTSIDVLKAIEEMNGIGYIAHINTSDIFTKNYLNESFRKTLLNFEHLKAIGLSDKSKQADVNQKISKYRKSEMCYILDSDSHGIDTIPNKCFWIKGQRCNYEMIEKALRDYTISLQLEKPKKPSKYIKGISIKPFDEGFLTGKDGGILNLMFSEDLNCLIGGRGTGKSTLINILIFLLSQDCLNEELLKFICLHEYILVLYHYQENDYIVFFNTPISEYEGNDDVLERFSEYYGSYKRKEVFNRKKIAEFALKYCFEIYRVSQSTLIQLSQKEAKQALSEFFNIGYSINELVSISSRGEISEFISSIILNNSSTIENSISSFVYSVKGVIKKLENIEKYIEERKAEIDKLLLPYNDSQSKKLRIIFSINNYGNYEAKHTFNKHKNDFFHDYNIKNSNLFSFLEFIENDIGLFALLTNLFNRNFNFFIEKYPISQYTEEMSQTLVNESIKEINKDNIENFYELLYRDITTLESIKSLNYQIKEYISRCQSFDLQFNINNKENISNKKELYRSIHKLSLGQKVVALLSFILSYGDYIEDTTPLIIDQPEDNLDNRYIYKNLVNDLRRVKVKRQVIIATHSSTIVTNAKAEQVIVMESNGEKGWVEETGFPTQKSIIKHILNYLEGGVDSFNHKTSIYKDVIRKL